MEHGQAAARTPTLPAAPGVPTPDSRRWMALMLLSGAFLMAVLASTAVFTAAPSIAEELGLSASGTQWIFTGNALAYGGLLLFGGRLSDLYGPRRMFMAGVALFIASSLLCGLAWSVPVLIAARVAQGSSAAVLTPAALSLVMTTFGEGRERNRALAVWSAIGGAGATVGLLVGGPVTDGPGWRWVFFINIPLGLAMLAFSPVLLRERRRRDQRRSLDAGGALTITAALVLLVYAVTQAPRVGWVTPRTIGPLFLSCLLIASFTIIESRSTAPLLPLGILRSRVRVGGNLILVAAGMAVDGMLFTITLYAQQVLGYSPVQFGLGMTVMTVASVVGAAVAQHLVTRSGLRLVAAAGTVLIGFACFLLTRVSVHGTFLDDLFAGLLVFGFGMGMAFTAGSIASLSGVAPSESGVASGLQNTSFSIGTALGVAVLSTVAVARTQAALAGAARTPPLAAQTAGYRSAFAVAAAIATLGLVAALTLLGTGHAAYARSVRNADRQPPRAGSRLN